VLDRPVDRGGGGGRLSRSLRRCWPRSRNRSAVAGACPARPLLCRSAPRCLEWTRALHAVFVPHRPAPTVGDRLRRGGDCHSRHDSRPGRSGGFQPSAASDTIRARCTSPAVAVHDRVRPANSTRSSSVATSGSEHKRSFSDITVTWRNYVPVLLARRPRRPASSAPAEPAPVTAAAAAVWQILAFTRA
jgi:hypothetical protein